jgi:sortase A
MNYTETVSGLSPEEYERLYNAAVEYNNHILERSNPFVLPEDQVAEYESLLNLGDNGIMGYIDIPVIDCYLPIYHGTDESILQTSIGHIDWTSLPVGGPGTHTVLSGHRGLPSARLFTDLNRVVVGDIFKLCVLDEILTYEVDQILIVEPEDISALQITPGMDYCTLVTCTPYGINTHRILCRGHRIANENSGSVRVTADSVQVQPTVVAPVIGVPLLVILVTAQVILDKRRGKDDWDEL